MCSMFPSLGMGSTVKLFNKLISIDLGSGQLQSGLMAGCSRLHTCLARAIMEILQCQIFYSGWNEVDRSCGRAEYVGKVGGSQLSWRARKVACHCIIETYAIGWVFNRGFLGF